MERKKKSLPGAGTEMRDHNSKDKSAGGVRLCVWGGGVKVQYLSDNTVLSKKK